MPSHEELERRVAEMEGELKSLRRGGYGQRGLRKRTAWGLGDIPFFSLAVGPDPAHGEARGHAKGIIAIGDIATGVLAIGGWARGVVAFGGLATGLISVGGLSIGILVGAGGVGIGAIALGGAAAGGVAIGGAAAGHYACGGGAAGTYVVSPARCDRQAVEFFERFGLRDACQSEPSKRMR